MSTPKAKELPMAFMHSSNDMYPEPDGVHVRKRQVSSADRISAFAHETNSRSQSRAEDDPKALTNAVVNLPIRQQVPSASKLPEEESQFSASDAEYWYHQYNQLKSAYYQVNDLWKKDSEGLLQRIANLEGRLAQHEGKFLTEIKTGKENDNAAYGTPDIVKASQEKLAALSNVSYTPPNVDGISAIPTPNEKSATDSLNYAGYIPPQPSSMSPGPSVTFGTATLASIPEHVLGLSVDDPPSPPSTAKIPTPPYLRVHAGHTPRVPNQELSGEDVNVNKARPGQYGSLGEDLALLEPRILPTKPQNSTELESLDEKLKRVASDLDMSIPQALRVDVSSPPPDLQTPGMARSPLAVEEPAEQMNGVKLKKKQSMNFGAPLLHSVKITPRSPDHEPF